MTELTPSQTTNLDRYGNGPLEWSRAREAIGDPRADITYFLGTCRPGGPPHAAGIGAQYLDGVFYFTSNLDARKARDLAADPTCTLSVRLPGIDLVCDGSAERVSDQETLERVAAGYQKSGWPAEVENGALTAPFSAPSAGPPPWHVFRLTFRTAVGVATAEPFGATKWQFDR